MSGRQCRKCGSHWDGTVPLTSDQDARRPRFPTAVSAKGILEAHDQLDMRADPCLPPVWYKSSPYRARAVADPRGVLADFAVSLPGDTQIRVWDSTAETRYLVLPMRPEQTSSEP